jgi:hypothetical protein
MRDLPRAALFVTVHIAIILAYLALAWLFLAPVPLIFGSAFIALVVAYLALGTAQATAIAAGLKQRGAGRWPALLVALLLACLPVLGSAAAVCGLQRWDGAGGSEGVLIRFFGPLAAIAVPQLLG